MTTAVQGIDNLATNQNNHGRRVGLEGGICGSFVSVALIYLLYDALFAPPASAQPRTGSGIPIANDSVDIAMNGWIRRPAIEPPAKNPVGSDQPPPLNANFQGGGIAGSNLNSDGSSQNNEFSGNNNSQSSFPSGSSKIDIGNSNLSEGGSNQGGLGLHTPMGFGEVGEELGYQQKPIVDNRYVGDEEVGEVLVTPPSYIQNPGQQTSNPFVLPPQQVLLVVVKTDPNVLATSIEGAAVADNSGTQQGILESTIITKGTQDQIKAFSERLLTTTALSDQDRSEVIQNLRHYGIDNSTIDTEGYASLIVVEAKDLLRIAQESGTSLYTTVDQEIAGVHHSSIDGTEFQDLVKVNTVTDIVFTGTSQTSDWQQDIQLNSYGLQGRASSNSSHPNDDDSSSNALAASTSSNPPAQEPSQPLSQPSSLSTQNVYNTDDNNTDDNNTDDNSPTNSGSSCRTGCTPVAATLNTDLSVAPNPDCNVNNIDSQSLSAQPPSTSVVDGGHSNEENTQKKSNQDFIDLGNGNNRINIKSSIGYDSLWNVNYSAPDCDSGNTINGSNSNVSLQAVAVDNYDISCGNGADKVSLQASINKDFINSWTAAMEEINLEIESISHEEISLRNSNLYVGEGNDSIVLKGDVINSHISTGKGADQLVIEGDFSNSIITLDEGNDVVLFIDPPALSGSLFGGSGLDTMSFPGTERSMNINLKAGLVDGMSIDSIERVESGYGDDWLWAAPETTWLNGNEGIDKYIFCLDQDGDRTVGNSLELGLTMDNLLSGRDQLLRWDEETSQIHMQVGVNLDQYQTLNSIAELINGVELIPIGDLDTFLLMSGVGDESDSMFSSGNQLALVTNILENRTALVEFNNLANNGYTLLAGLSASTSNAPSDEGVAVGG